MVSEFNQTSAKLSLNFLEILDGNAWMNILRLFIAANTLATNSFLLCLFARFPELGKSLCNKLIQLNAIMDLICGFGPLFRAVFQFYTAGAQIREFAKLTCIFMGSPYTFGFAASQITFIAISIDRLIAIASPLGYMDYKRNKFALIVGFFAFFFGAFSIFIVFIGLDVKASSAQCSIASNSGPYFSTYWTIFMGLCTLIIFTNYVAILVFYFKQKTSTIQTYAISTKMQQEIKKSNQMKLTKTIALILLIYTFAWAIPTSIWLIFLLLDSSNTMRMNYVSYAQGYITACGCGLNLYIYLFKHAEIRRYALKLIGFERQNKQVDGNIKWAVPTQMQQYSTYQR